MLGFLKRLKIPHVFTLLTLVVLFCAVLTWFIPSGEYRREQRTIGHLTRTVVVPGTFQTLPKRVSVKGVMIDDRQEGSASPVSFEGFLSAIPRGMIEAGDIIFFIFIIGGTFGILQRTGTITAGIHAILDRFRDSWRLLTIVLMIVLAIGGSTLGMAEEYIPLIPIFLVVAKEIGCDRAFAVGIVSVAAQTGFAAATTNPFTVNIAQGIAELPLNSAMPFRLAFFVCALAVAISHVLRYGARVRSDPSLSVMAEDGIEVDGGHGEAPAWNATHGMILAACLVIFVFILYAVQALGWWLPEMAGGFFLMGIAAIVIGRLPLDDGVRAAVRGMEEMVVAALVVGFARGVTVVMTDGMILDTLIHAAATTLQQVPRLMAAEGMLVFQTTLNFFIPSGSGQAAVTMPLMAPLSDVLGLTRQTAVFAFTCGDGFSNLVIPTSGVLMAMLGLAKVPFERWIRFVVPVFLQLIILSALFVGVSVLIGLQ